MIRSLFCLTALSLVAQGPPPPRAAPQAPKASSSPIKELVRADLSPAETGTPEALTAALYAFISGPKDQKRDSEKIRALFHLQARIMVAARHPEKGAFIRPMELEAFLAFAIPQWERGFFERGTALTVQKQDGVAQVWSPYEIRLAADGPALYTGVNALQCAWDGKRWWITHLQFQSAPTAALAATLDGPKK
ncbi:MAG: hypothetical protein Q8K67_09595 [Geothrix sp.]|nr:hypothetical protein [Geothrix sp.]